MKPIPVKIKMISTLCVLVLALAAGAVHAQAWAVPYNFDYVGTWVANHNLSLAVGHCVNGLGGCAGGNSKPRAQAAPSGARPAPRYTGSHAQAVYPRARAALLYTGEDFATHDGIKQLVSHFPAEKQPEMAKEFATLILTFNKTIPHTYGIPQNNLATAYAAILAGSYSAYTNQPFPDNAVKPLFMQINQIMLSNPKIYQAGMDEKNAVYQQWVGTGMFMLMAREELAKNPDPTQQAQLQKMGGNALRALLSVEPDRVRFTANGMELL